MLVKSTLKVAFPDVEPQKCQYSYGEKVPSWSYAKGFAVGGLEEGKAGWCDSLHLLLTDLPF